MAQPKKNEGAFEGALRTAALRLPDVEEGIACKGTAVESRTYKVRNKAFLFVRPENVMLRVQASQAEAARFASTDPDGCRVGAGGWVTLRPGAGTMPSIVVMTRWLEESYRLYADTSARSAKKRPAKKSLAKKRVAANTRAAKRT